MNASAASASAILALNYEFVVLEAGLGHSFKSEGTVTRLGVRYRSPLLARFEGRVTNKTHSCFIGFGFKSLFVLTAEIFTLNTD